MTLITFPRTFPDEFPVLGLSFVRVPMQEISPLRSGAQITKNLGPTLWRAKSTSLLSGPGLQASPLLLRARRRI